MNILELAVNAFVVLLGAQPVHLGQTTCIGIELLGRSAVCPIPEN